jgi:hypothetical protein
MQLELLKINAVQGATIRKIGTMNKA